MYWRSRVCKSTTTCVIKADYENVQKWDHCWKECKQQSSYIHQSRFSKNLTQPRIREWELDESSDNCVEIDLSFIFFWDSFQQMTIVSLSYIVFLSYQLFYICGVQSQILSLSIVTYSAFAKLFDPESVLVRRFKYVKP